MTANAANATPAIANAKPVSFATLVTREAVSALRSSNKAQYSATVNVALWLAQKQVDSAGTDAGIDDKLTKGHWRMFAKALASRGEMVFRDTEHLIAAIMLQPAGDKRNKAASEYVDKHGKGLKLTDALGRLRTYAFRLMSDIHKNHAGILRELAQSEKDGIGAEFLRDRWQAFVSETYGDSFNSLTEALAKPAKPKTETNAVDSIVKRAKDMSDADLARLVSSLVTMAAERANAMAEAQAMLDGEEGEEGEGEETPADIANAA